MTLMSTKDANRTIIIGQVLEKKLSQKKAALRLGISIRQVRRTVKRMRLQGPLSLPHKNLGKPSNNDSLQELKKSVLSLLQEKYPDFGPTLTAEKLASIVGIEVSREWLRKLMISKGLWQPKHIKTSIHQPRARRPQYGELIQMDGSHYAWFESRGDKCVALVFVDDATSRLQAVYFCPTEDLNGYFTAMKIF